MSERACPCKCLYLFAVTIIDAKLLICLFAADIGNVPTGPASEDVDDDDVPGRCYLRVWSRKMETEWYLGNFGSCGPQFLAFSP